MRQWARHYRADHLRPEGGEAITISTARFKGGSSKIDHSNHPPRAEHAWPQGVVVDVDPQGQHDHPFGFLPDAEVDVTQTLLPLFSGDGSDVSYAIRPTYWDGVDLGTVLPPSSAEFIASDATVEGSRFQFWRTLDYGLDPIRSKYDVIICDTPPSLSFLTVNALMASDGIIMPLPPSNLDFASSAVLGSVQGSGRRLRRPGAGKDFAFINILLSKVGYAAPKDNTGQSTAIIREDPGRLRRARAAGRDSDVEAVGPRARSSGPSTTRRATTLRRAPSRAPFEAYDRFVDLIEQQIERNLVARWEVEVAAKRAGNRLQDSGPCRSAAADCVSRRSMPSSRASHRVGMLSRDALSR